MSQSVGMASKQASKFPEYDEMLAETLKYWQRGDAKLLSEKLSHKGIPGRKIKSATSFVGRISLVLNDGIKDLILLMEMHKHVEPRKKMVLSELKKNSYHEQTA